MATEDGKQYELPFDYPAEEAPKIKRRRRRDIYFSSFSVKQILLLLALAEIVIGGAICLSWLAVHA